MCCAPFNGLRSRIMAAVLLLAGAASSLCSIELAAGEVTEFVLSHKQGIYQLKLEMILDASVATVHHVVTDYVHIYRLNSSIVESEVIPAPDHSSVRVKTRMNDCILFFCREILRVEDVRELGKGTIQATVVPQLSNVKSGTTIWQIRPLGHRTRIRFILVLEPGFFIPPLIGPHIVKQKLREEVLTTLDRACSLTQHAGIG
jgi:hypothetical protein